MKKEKLFELILFIAIMAGAGYAVFSDAHNFPNRWFTRDDAYYYFKVAQNISEGLGSAFDGINLSNGYHPLWLLVNIPIFSLARVDLVLPLRVLILVMGALHAGSAILLYRLISNVLSRVVAILAATFWAFNFYIYATTAQFGLETGLVVFSSLLFLYYAEKLERKWRTESLTRKEIITFALLAVMVMFSRLDTIFFVLFFGIYLVFRKTPLRYLLLSDILGILFFTFANVIYKVGMKEYYLFGESTLKITLLFIAISLLIYYFSGLYQHPCSMSVRSLVLRIATAFLASILIIFLAIPLLQRVGFVESFPRSVLFINLIPLLITRFGVRYLSPKRVREKIPPLQLLRENWKTWLSEGFAYFGIVGGALGVYMLFNQLYFGTPSPVSGQVKRWWGSLSGNVYGGSANRKYTFFGLDAKPDSDFNAWGFFTQFTIWMRDTLTRWVGYSDKDSAYWQLFVLIVILIVIILLLNKKRAMRASVKLGLLPLFVGALAQVIFYHATGYSAVKEWYWVTQLIFTVFLFALLLDILFLSLVQHNGAVRNFAYLATILLAFFWAQNFYMRLAHLMPYGVVHEGHEYMEIIAVVEENTEEGTLIGMTGGGNLGYFIENRTIVNMDGLINSYEYFQLHKDGRGDEHFEAMELDYVFSNPLILAELPYKGEYEERLGQPTAYYRKKAVMKFLR